MRKHFCRWGSAIIGRLEARPMTLIVFLAALFVATVVRLLSVTRL